MEVIYEESAGDSIRELSDLYFGYVGEIHIVDGDEETWGIISDTKLFENRDNLKPFLLSLFGYEKDTPCRIYESDGYIREKKWKAIEQPETAAEHALNPFVDMIEATAGSLAKQPEMVTV